MSTGSLKKSLLSMHFIFKQLFNIFDVCGDWKMAGIQRKGTVEFEKLRFI